MRRLNQKTTLFCLMVALLMIKGSSKGQIAKSNTGRMILQFSETHPLTHPKYMIPRHGWDRMRERGTFITTGVYDITKETFSVYIPESYDGSQAFGLIVWISAGDKGSPRDSYLPVLDKLQLLWIGANDIGNNRYTPDRMALTLDGLHNILQRYHVDPERIYVSGLSGGGRVASHLAIIYPELFAGGFYIIGCDYRENLPSDVEGQYWPGFWPFSNDTLVEIGHSNRYTLLTGSHDFNQSGTEKVWQAYHSEGKKWIAYVEVPEMDHRYPNAHWYHIGLTALDRPLRLMNDSLNILPHFPAKSDVSPNWIQEQMNIAKNLSESSPLQSAFILDRVSQVSKGFPENKEVKTLLKYMLEDKSLKKALRIRIKIHQWHLKLLEKGYSKNWIKTMLKLERSIQSVIEENPSESLRQELQWMLEIL